MTRGLFLTLVLLLPAAAFAQDVTLDIVSIERPATAKVIVVTANVTNHSGASIHDVRVLARLEHTRTILAGQSDETWSCRDAGTLQSVQCVAASLAPGQAVPLTLYIDAQHGRFRFVADATWPGGLAPAVTRIAWFPHDIHVTHDGDEGEGSLRRAIALANEDCEGLRLPCRIAFDAPMTIRPRTPLPAIWGSDVAVDGDGRVTIDGSQVSGGSGLEIVGSGSFEIVLRNLTIRSFPWDGVHVDKSNLAQVTVEDCTIEGNGSRGITSEAGSQVLVRRSGVRRNGRSGLFLLGPNNGAEENVIEDNGASGVFIANYNARVVRNRITGNAHFGVAVPRSLGTIEISENSIASNAILGIDRGLDGSDGDRYDDYATHHAYIPPPRLTEAVFDAMTNTTTISGTYFDARDHWGTWSIEVYSNPAAEAQGETFLGRTSAANGRFSLTLAGDLRGRFITATGRRHLFLGLSGDWWWTSEFAAVVEVR